MRLGLLNREVTIERKSVTQETTYGSATVTWVPLVEQSGSPVVAERFPAQVIDFAASQQEAVVRGGLEMVRRLVRIRLRWRDDIDSTMRVTLHGDTDVVMKIVGGPTEFGGRKEGIELLCEEASS